jgi:hypothetical protein
MPRFSLKEMLVAISLIALGIAALRVMFTIGPGTEGSLPMLGLLGLWLAGGALIGAGLVRLFDVS